MPDYGEPLVLADLSWPEVDAIRDQVEAVLIPVGSNEQHGPNLALKMDIVGATEFCKRASAMRNPQLMVAPSMPWGVSFHHMNFPGTISLSPDTFIQTLVEVVASLMDHGFQRFMIVNGHGGNIAPLGNAVVRINEELGPTFVGSATYFSFADKELHTKFEFDKDIIGHACQMETSAAMFLAPEIVKTDSLAAGEMTDLTYEFRGTLQRYGVSVPYRFDEYTRNGALGDARKATREMGEELMTSALNNFVAFMDELIAWTPVEAEAGAH
ncbi:MAG TPA: creatininase family protein [Thermomicrobiales bacterium]|nr:creatininase family protein [Thermomicrobiales bacterium]